MARRRAVLGRVHSRWILSKMLNSAGGCVSCGSPYNTGSAGNRAAPWGMAGMFTNSAEIYDAIYEASVDFAAASTRIDALIQQRKRTPGASLLDVGCGTGAFLTHLHRQYAVEGLELDAGMLAVARWTLSRLPDSKWSMSRRVSCPAEDSMSPWHRWRRAPGMHRCVGESRGSRTSVVTHGEGEAGTGRDIGIRARRARQVDRRSSRLTLRRPVPAPAA